jgi:hypothetical protein
VENYRINAFFHGSPSEFIECARDFRNRFAAHQRPLETQARRVYAPHAPSMERGSREHAERFLFGARDRTNL